MERPLILIVDDDAMIRDGLGELAEALGFRVMFAPDGPAALALASTRPPSAIVTDLRMPSTGGGLFIPRLRALPGLGEVPVLVVTPDASRERKIELLSGGADDFILTPVDPQDFKARLLTLGRRGAVASALTLATNQRDAALLRLGRYHRELEQLTAGLVAAVERASELNDTDTANHIRSVSAMAELLGRAIGLDDASCESLGRYAGLHDVGKVGIRDAILQKPGALTPQEFDEMKGHTLIGAELLRAAGLPPIAVNIPLCHHERWDGTGYPRGLAGEDIPIEARIVAVADVFDALCSRRYYKPAFKIDQSRDIMKTMAGGHLDATLVEAFLARTDEVTEIRVRYYDE